MGDIIIKPMVTERLTEEAERFNRYGFIVDKDANKFQIRESIEKMYSVSVTGVRTMNYMGKKNTRFTTSGMIKGNKSSYKKAIVTVAEGDSIDFYAGI
ncbi:MAG: 50S ribosomal protein L23 [Flavobacteriales bacterium]|nr:50S ribosomal protein L23 [Flavobacteriales bacterium]